MRSLIDEGEHPLIQPDLLDSDTLLRVLQLGGDFSRVTPWRLATELRGRYFRPLGPMQCHGLRLTVWTTLPAQPLTQIKTRLSARVATFIGLAP